MPNDYDPDNPQHQRLLAAAILASLEDEDVVRYPSECVLTRDAEAKLLQVMAMAGCDRREIGATMRLEAGTEVH